MAGSRIWMWRVEKPEQHWGPYGLNKAGMFHTEDEANKYAAKYPGSTIKKIRVGILWRKNKLN